LPFRTYLSASNSRINYILYLKYDGESLETLGRHPSELGHVVAMNHVAFDDCGSIDLLDGFLSDIDPVVDDEKRIGCPEYLII
jgi:hypothetical protein